MRTFNSGATRDDNTGKLNYVRGLSAQVQQRYLEYLRQHRLQQDGSLRDWDNWKQGIDVETYRESLSRHVHDAVRASMGLPVPDDASLEDLLCAVIFNAGGWLFELLAFESGVRELDSPVVRSCTCGECACYEVQGPSGDGPCHKYDIDPDEDADPMCFVPKEDG